MAKANSKAAPAAPESDGRHNDTLQGMAVAAAKQAVDYIELCSALFASIETLSFELAEDMWEHRSAYTEALSALTEKGRVRLSAAKDELALITTHLPGGAAREQEPPENDDVDIEKALDYLQRATGTLELALCTLNEATPENLALSAVKAVLELAEGALTGGAAKPQSRRSGGTISR